MKPGTIHWMKSKQDKDVEQALRDDSVIKELDRERYEISYCMGSVRPKCFCAINSDLWDQHYKRITDIGEELKERIRSIKLVYGRLD